MQRITAQIMPRQRVSGVIRPCSGSAGGGGGGGGGGSAYATTDAAIFAVAENAVIAPVMAGAVTIEE